MAKKITTEKEAITAIANGTVQYENLPASLRKLESVCLAAVKANGGNLLFVNTQTFDICLAAFQCEEDEAVLGFVDPELRTVALLEACGVDTEDYDGIETIVAQNADGWEDTNETYSVIVCGKGNPEWLPTALKVFRRHLALCTEWKEVWDYHPMEAAEYSMYLSPDNSSFEISFHYGNSPSKTIVDFQDYIDDYFYDSDSFYPQQLGLFLYTSCETSHNSSCGYRILGPFGKREETIMEKKDWSFEMRAYDDSNDSGEVNDIYFSYIKKRRDLWLLEGTANTDVIKQTKASLASAKKEAEKYDKSRRSQS
jgi:hypothetical protein